jgi:predicted Zn finger-like uncharacterized protein
MLIVCPSCATAYDVEPAVLQHNGREVRCVRCRNVWRVEMTQAEKLLAAASALAPGADSTEIPERAPIDEGAVAAAASFGPADAVEWTDPPPDVQPEDSQPLAGQVGDGWDPGSIFGEGLGAGTGDGVEIEAPPIAPVDLDAGRPPIDIAADSGADSAGEPPEDIETAAARRYPRGIRRPQKGWSLSRWQVAILVLIILDAIVIGWRVDFVRIMPQTASFYGALGLQVNLRGLSFDEVATSMESHEGVPILVVQGSIINDTPGVVDVPRLKFIVRNAGRQELYSWTAVPTLQRLTAYQAEAFTARLASPPPGSRDVLVRFLNRRDFAAGER